MATTAIDQYLKTHAGTQGDSLALADAPNRSSFLGGTPCRLTWSELDRSVDEAVQVLRSVGVGPGDSVAVQLPNVVELVTTLLACFRMGATAVPLPIQYRDHEITQCLSLSEPTVFVSSDRPDRPDQMSHLGEIISGLSLEILLLDVIQITSAIEAGSAATTAKTPEFATSHLDSAKEPTATICWTSGTTGVPKGVPRNHSMWLASGRFQVEELGLGSQDRLLCPFPIVNMAGIGGMVIPWLLSGAGLFLHQPLDLQVFLQQVSSEQITYTVAPPPLLNMLLATPQIMEGVDMASLTRIASGSAPLDPGMVSGWHERGVEIINVFGSNEGAALLSTGSSVPDPERRARFFPRPNSLGVQTRLVDSATGADITAAGMPGELRFSGPTVFAGYLESDGSEFDEQGYFCTGDVFEWVGEAQPPTLLRFVDRLKDIIIRGGMNIAAAEVEGLLASHPQVSECAAVGYSDPELGERLGVFVVIAGEETLTLDSLIDHLRSLDVASFKLPERLEVVSVLPRNAVGKVLKPQLREAWAS